MAKCDDHGDIGPTEPCPPPPPKKRMCPESKNLIWELVTDAIIIAELAIVLFLPGDPKHPNKVLFVDIGLLLALIYWSVRAGWRLGRHFEKYD